MKPAAGSLSLVLLGMGRMGRMVDAVATERGHRIAGRFASAEAHAPVPAGSDVAIDFSLADAVVANVRRCAEARCSLVLGTTGWERAPGARGLVEATAKAAGIGVVMAPNFSFAMHLFRRIVEQAAALASGDAELDVWIEESHHRMKADHPSGTALALAQAVMSRHRGKKQVVTHLPDGPVAADSLVVASARGGWEPGLHRVVLDGPEECITLEHRARSRRAFALGAVRAAEWVRGRSGVFTLDDVLSIGGPD